MAEGVALDHEPHLPRRWGEVTCAPCSEGRRKLQLALPCLLPDDRPLPPGGPDAGRQPRQGHAPAGRRVHPEAQPPSWLATGALLAHFAPDRAVAVRRYRRFVAQGMDAESVWPGLNRQVLLGDEAFVARMQSLLREGSADTSIPRVQQRPPAPPLEDIALHYPNRDAAIAAAHATGAYSYQQIAEAFGLHFTTVGRIVRAVRKADAV